MKLAIYVELDRQKIREYKKPELEQLKVLTTDIRTIDFDIDSTSEMVRYVLEMVGKADRAVLYINNPLGRAEWGPIPRFLSQWQLHLSVPLLVFLKNGNEVLERMANSASQGHCHTGLDTNEQKHIIATFL